MKWNDDFWNVKKNAPTLGLGGKDAIDLYAKGRKKRKHEEVTYEKWLKESKALAAKLKALGYPPVTITIKNAGDEIKKFLSYHKDGHDYYRKMYIIDIYSRIPENSPIGIQLQNEGLVPANWWLRTDCNKPTIRRRGTYVFEVLQRGSKDFTMSDYQGFIVGEGYGEHTFSSLRNPTLTHYNDAW